MRVLTRQVLEDDLCGECWPKKASGLIGNSNEVHEVQKFSPFTPSAALFVTLIVTLCLGGVAGTKKL